MKKVTAYRADGSIIKTAEAKSFEHYKRHSMRAAAEQKWLAIFAKQVPDCEFVSLGYAKGFGGEPPVLSIFRMVNGAASWIGFLQAGGTVTSFSGRVVVTLGV